MLERPRTQSVIQTANLNPAAHHQKIQYSKFVIKVTK